MSTADYPLPAVAVSLWLAGPKLMVGMDSRVIQLPCTLAGMQALLEILKERQRGNVRIGTAGAPTKLDAERLAALQAALTRPDTTAAKTRAKAEAAGALLEELGL